MSTEEELFLVLSNADRLSIIALINGEPLRLSQIAKRLSTTVQETSRHLERLNDARIVVRNPDASYKLTSLGKMVLSFLPSFGLLQKYRDYFLSHDLSSLPPEYVRRIGDLSDCDLFTHVDQVLGVVEKIIQETDEYLLFMSDRPIFHHQRILKNPETLSVRVIVSKDAENVVMQTARNLWTKTKFEIRQRPNIGAAIVMNEKSAAVCFPALDGKLDLTSILMGQTQECRRWCHDLFEYRWGS